MIQFDNHTRISENTNCVWNTSFFTFNPKDMQKQKYDMYISNTGEQNIKLFIVHEFLSWENYLTLGYIVLVVVTYSVTICTGFYKIQKNVRDLRKQNIEYAETGTVSSFHEYATIDELV